MVVLDFIRHAQALSNLSVGNQQMRDPQLTKLGIDQCQTLHDSYPHTASLKMLVASPLQRAIQTCLQSFGDHVRPGSAIVALPELQELSSQPSDVGLDPEQLQGLFGGLTNPSIDLSAVHPGWNYKAGDSPFAPTLDKIESRGRTARRLLRALTAHLDAEDHVAIVSHGAMLHFITEDYANIPHNHPTSWMHVEFRSYVFADPTGDDDDNATLCEILACREARLGYDAVDLDDAQLAECKQKHMENVRGRLAVIERDGRGFKY